jgi:hypothetical protein
MRHQRVCFQRASDALANGFLVSSIFVVDANDIRLRVPIALFLAARPRIAWLPFVTSPPRLRNLPSALVTMAAPRENFAGCFLVHGCRCSLLDRSLTAIRFSPCRVHASKWLRSERQSLDSSSGPSLHSKHCSPGRFLSTPSSVSLLCSTGAGPSRTSRSRWPSQPFSTPAARPVTSSNTWPHRGKRRGVKRDGLRPGAESAAC